MSGTLRVLPLGGVGEIGKNMTVVEYDGKIVVVDCGLRFPTAEMMGIDLVLPDFTYLREHVDDIEAIVITHGHEDHVGALPWVLRDLGETSVPVIYGGQLTVAMARSKLDEHRLREANLEVLPTGQKVTAGPFEIELVHLTHSIPDMVGVILRCELGTVLFTGDYKFDQTPVGGAPADVSRLAELGRDGVLLLCGDSTNADRPGTSVSESVVGPNLERVFARCSGRIVTTSFASNIHRVQQVVDAAVALERKVCLVGRSMRKNVNIGRTLGHIVVPEGTLIPPRELDNWPDDRVVIISTGSQGEPLERAAAHGLPRPPADRAPRGRHRGLLRHPDPRQRAGGQRDDRPALPDRLRGHHVARRGDPRVRARLSGGAEADAQPDPAEVRDAGPRRLQAASGSTPSSPRRSACRPRTCSRARTGCRSRSPPPGPNGASARRRG